MADTYVDGAMQTEFDDPPVSWLPVSLGEGRPEDRIESIDRGFHKLIGAGLGIHGGRRLRAKKERSLHL